jgi:hypothetical protein
MLRHVLENARRKIMRLQKMPETADRGFVRCRFGAKINARKGTQRRRSIKHFFRRRIREIEPVLQKMNAQPPLQRKRRAAIAGHRIMRLDQRTQTLPGYDRIHPRQKRSPAGRLRLALETRTRECDLAHPKAILPLNKDRMN